MAKAFGKGKTGNPFGKGRPGSAKANSKDSAAGLGKKKPPFPPKK